MPYLSKTFPKRYPPSKIYLKIYHIKVFGVSFRPVWPKRACFGSGDPAALGFVDTDTAACPSV